MRMTVSRHSLQKRLSDFKNAEIEANWKKIGTAI
jgi:hypothetical protein